MNKSLTLTLTMPAELKKRIERERSVPAWDSLERVSQAGRAKSFLCPPFVSAAESGDAALISFIPAPPNYKKFFAVHLTLCVTRNRSRHGICVPYNIR